MNKGIVLFDGDCHICNRSVQFILHRDRNDYFRFASLQSEIGGKLLDQYGIPHDYDSIVFISDHKAYCQSDAVCQICLHLSGLWKIFYLGKYIPSPIRNWLYRFVAEHRYLFNSQQKACPIPTEKERKAMLQ
ncbi:thiol-disulfide oxidoreductase DCC family protein [Bacillus testis]|uniref:thiol-disulfide oxidoreductase DCC family protein n=1 Tax=Bacillus testis TaxID=1622072 RepID=UPI0009461D16|nr:DCC1-like thiol-disulfide oxidoreductase family protein [Bacillus testis]